jgi:hypothetical protein
MLRLLVLVLIVAGVAGYFTKPDQAAHERQADILFRGVQEQAIGKLDIGGLVNAGLARLRRTTKFEDLYVATKYTVTVSDKPYIQCYGAYTKVFCSFMPGAEPGQPAAAEKNKGE